MSEPGNTGAPGAESGDGNTSALRIDVFTLFPDMVSDVSAHSMIGRARTNGLIDLRTHDIRDEATDRHRTVDDTPFGGGAGMVLKAEPVFSSVERVDPPRPLYLLGPGGRRFDQALASQLAAHGGFSLICGRYEGVDHRVRSGLVDGELSLGDFVLAGGEAAAGVIIEAVGRLVPGVLGNENSALTESFSTGLLEHPQFTKPAEFRGMEVPEVLRSGDHGRVERWRVAQSLARTNYLRPDLIDARGGLTEAEADLLQDLGPEPTVLEGWEAFAYPDNFPRHPRHGS